VRFRLTDDEAWELIAGSHTGIFTSLRRDGRPIALPVWFVAHGRSVYIRTPAATKQTTRVRHDSRAHFLVEHGTDWGELVSVSFSARAGVLDPDPSLDKTLEQLLADKYAAHRPPEERLPAAVRERYAETELIRLTPDGPLRSWNNAALLG
jgi:hypothetical protein